MPSILLVDDEPNILEVLEIVLKDAGMDVCKCSSGREALGLLRERTFDLAISDIKMPDLSGVQLLEEAKQFTPETIFIMITAYASTETAVEAIQHGAYDYLTKPFKMEELTNVVNRALHQNNPKRGGVSPKRELEAQQGQKLFQALHRSRIVGKSSKMLDVYRTIGTIAGGGSTVLITGESGTGKELVARAIHEASSRRDGPFVSINCGAFPETLLESELFGYTKGAFTGANGIKKGLFEVSSKGSIFLDEIGDMTPAMQVKILRALQDRKIRPLGAANEIPVDVRVIAATNRDLQASIQNGQFREDLYYRIAVINIHIPPLRERMEDISLLALHFLRLYAEKTGKKISAISSEAMNCLEAYRWPGNVRELENAIERAVALETTDEIQLERLPKSVALNQAPAPASEGIPIPEGSCDLEEFLAQVECHLICNALKKTDGNQTQAAQILNITKGSLRHKIQVLQIDPWTFRRRLPDVQAQNHSAIDADQSSAGIR